MYPLGLVDTGAVRADQTERIAVVEREWLPVELQSEQGVAIVCLETVQRRRPVDAERLERLDTRRRIAARRLCASVFVSLRSLIARTCSTCFCVMARKTLRPMRPKPLIP